MKALRIPTKLLTAPGLTVSHALLLATFRLPETRGMTNNELVEITGLNYFHIARCISYLAKTGYVTIAQEPLEERGAANSLHLAYRRIVVLTKKAQKYFNEINN